MDGKSFFFGEAVSKKAELQKSLERYGRKATGRTIAAIREEHTETGFEIYGPRHIYTLVYGRGPTSPNGPYQNSGQSLLQSIKEWIAAKGLNLNPFAVTAKIHKRGTRLYIQIQRGGQPSKVLEDVFGNNYQKQLEERVKTSLYQGLRNQIAQVNSNIQTF